MEPERFAWRYVGFSRTATHHRAGSHLIGPGPAPGTSAYAAGKLK